MIQSPTCSSLVNNKDQENREKEHEPTRTGLAKTAERFVAFLKTAASFKRRLGTHPGLAGNTRTQFHKHGGL